jgi:hypothetical protein
MELGQYVFAAGHGKLWDKLRAQAYLLNPANWNYLWRRRRMVQARRAVSDRRFVGQHSGVISFGPLKSRALRWVGNPIFAGYWAVTRWLIFW